MFANTRKEQEHFEKFLVNLSSGDKMISIAAAVTAATLGIGSFHCQGDKCVMLLPMKLAYQELVPDVKMNILQAIENAGGQVEGLTGLVE